MDEILPSPYKGEPGRPKKSVRKRKPTDGSVAITHAGREELAWFLASPRKQREYHSIAEFTEKKINLPGCAAVSTQTVYRWAVRADVLARAGWLVRTHKREGTLIAQREWVAIVEAQVERAKKGDLKAAEFCWKLAWPKSFEGEDPDSEMTLEEAIRATENVGKSPSWCVHEFDASEQPEPATRAEKTDAEEKETASASDLLLAHKS